MKQTGSPRAPSSGATAASALGAFLDAGHDDRADRRGAPPVPGPTRRAGRMRERPALLVLLAAVPLVVLAAANIMTRTGETPAFVDQAAQVCRTARNRIPTIADPPDSNRTDYTLQGIATDGDTAPPEPPVPEILHHLHAEMTAVYGELADDLARLPASRVELADAAVMVSLFRDFADRHATLDPANADSVAAVSKAARDAQRAAHAFDVADCTELLG